RARSGIVALADRHSQQVPKASRRWPLMHRRARYGDAGGAWTGSTSAQNGSRWCSAQTAFSRSRGTSANQPQRGQAITQLISTELASARIGPERGSRRWDASNIRCPPMVPGESDLLVGSREATAHLTQFTSYREFDVISPARKSFVRRSTE